MADPEIKPGQDIEVSSFIMRKTRDMQWNRKLITEEGKNMQKQRISKPEQNPRRETQEN